MTGRGARAVTAALLAAAMAAGTAAVPSAAQAARSGPVANVAGAAGGASPPTLGALYRDGQTNRYLLGGRWLYRADPAGLGLALGWFRPSPSQDGWTPTAVPDAFNAGDLSAASMAGSVGWYRRDFTVPAGAFARYVPAAARAWIVRFESVNYRATVWLNGRLIGTHAGAYLPFELDLRGVHQGANELVVRVDSRRGPGDLPPGPGGGWWNYGGLLREVYLRPVQEADIARVQVRTLMPCPYTGGGGTGASACQALVDEQVVVRNPTGRPAQVSLSGRYGSLPLNFGAARIAPGGSWTARAQVRLAHAHLWAIGSPYLYRATLTLIDGKGRHLAGYVTYSGVRTIAVDSQGRLTLNGRLLNLRGVNLHEQTLSEGAALDPGQLRILFNEARSLGATMIRAHYPLNPQLEEMADRAGVLLWSEIPVYQTSSQYLAQAGWRRNAYGVLENNILTNQNHPSVALWSIANELETPATAAEAGYVAGAAALAHKLDPTRPAGMAISDWPGIGCQPAYAPLDVIGFNDYFGWYDAGGGTTDDRDQLSPFLDSLRACYPHKAVMVTEFGFEANRNGPVEERGTYQFQVNSAAFHLAVFASKGWLSGALYFVLRDFAVTPGWSGGNPWPDPPFLHKGLFDLAGNPKPAAAVVSASFHATRQIGPAPRRPARGL